MHHVRASCTGREGGGCSHPCYPPWREGRRRRLRSPLLPAAAAFLPPSGRCCPRSLPLPLLSAAGDRLHLGLREWRCSPSPLPSGQGHCLFCSPPRKLAPSHLRASARNANGHSWWAAVPPTLPLPPPTLQHVQALMLKPKP